jgi:uncharacterized protein (DUF885 family)
MRYSIVALAVLGLLTACGQPQENNSGQNSQTAAEQPKQTEQSSQSETERLNQWFEEKYEEQLQQSPIQMTFLGRKDRYGDIDDMTVAAEKKQLQWLENSVEELKANFDYDKLGQEAQTSYDVWVYQYEQAKRNAEFRGMGYVFDQMRGAHTFLPQFLINFHRVDDAEDMEAYISRINGGATAIEQLLQRAKQQVENGVRAPRFAYEQVIKEAKGLISGAPFDEEGDSSLLEDAKNKLSSLQENDKISAEQADKYEKEVRKALLERFRPSYEALISFLESDIENTDEVATGVHRLENGKAYYNALLKNYTTTDLTADEIHQIGLNEVERLTQEMIAIKDKVGFEGDLQAFFTFIRTDEQFFYPNNDEGAEMYLEDSREYLAYINEKLPEYFGILPKADLVVKRVEPFREQDGAAQHYYPGSPDGERPGIYYAHLSDMSSMPKNEMEAIAYHEGNPGHHMQISIAQELESVPEFRTQAGFTVYSEGWGLYSEQLAKEMGAYEDPYSDFGRLTTEIWRAVRLVVDTGMHAKGWTEEEAVKYFQEHTPIAEGAVRSEVRRYLVMPGQATAYKIGMIRILELREEAKEALGDKFDIRGFHDTILGGGALPLHILERRVDQWVEKQKKA